MNQPVAKVNPWAVLAVFAPVAAVVPRLGVAGSRRLNVRPLLRMSGHVRQRASQTNRGKGDDDTSHDRFLSDCVKPLTLVGLFLFHVSVCGPTAPMP